MLVYSTKLVGTPVLSVQEGGPLGQINASIVDPDNLKIIAFRLIGPGVDSSRNLLAAQSIREYSTFGMIIDSEGDSSPPLMLSKSKRSSLSILIS